MQISMIVAADEHNVIGGHNTLLWHLPADFARMKQITMGHPLIMGRKTHESIGRALPGRRNIVVTHQQDAHFPGCEVVSSLEEAFEVTKHDESDEVFIFGGAEIYKQAMPFAGKIYLTRVHGTFDGDVFFPEIDEREWKEVFREDHEADGQNPYAYSFITYERRK